MYFKHILINSLKKKNVPVNFDNIICIYFEKKMKNNQIIVKVDVSLNKSFCFKCQWPHGVIWDGMKILKIWVHNGVSKIWVHNGVSFNSL